MSRALSRVAVTVALAAVVSTVSACTGGTPAPTPTQAAPSPSGDGVLRIGTLFPGTGPTAGLGPGLTAGVNAAVREINAAGGVLGAPVEVVNRDAGDGTTELVTQSFDDLVAHGVDVVIGPMTAGGVELVRPAATAASVPVISPGSTGTAHGTIVARLLLAREASTVALVRIGGQPATDTVDALAATLAEHDGDLVQISGDGDAAAVAEQVATAGPDAVVIASPDAGDATVAVIASLASSGFAAERLWLIEGTVTRYAGTLPTGTLEGSTGIVRSFPPGDELIARLLLEDPGARSLAFAAEAYDATVLAALAATIAGEDGGASITAALGAAAGGGIPCSSFGECLDVLTTRDDIDYQGVTGSLDRDEHGELAHPRVAVYEYTAENSPAFVEWTGGDGG